MRKGKRTPKATLRIYLDGRWQEVFVYFTREELLSFIVKLFDAFFIDCCPSCQLSLNWHDYISEDDIKRKIEEIVKKGKKL
jgi:hypothetical protein